MPPKEKVPPKKRVRKVKKYRYYGLVERLTDSSGSDTRGYCRPIARPRPPVAPRPVPAVVAPSVPAVIEPESEEDTKPPYIKPKSP